MSEQPAQSVFTATEQKVAEALAAGKTNREIADACSIAEKTVKTHLTRIYKKLGVGNCRQAIVVLLA